MKYAISNIAWPKAHDKDILSTLHGLGFTGLEIAPTRLIEARPYDQLDTATKIAQQIRADHQLEMASMQSIWYGRTETLFQSEEDRQVLSDYTKKAILFAKSIGCRHLVFGSPRNRVRGNHPASDVHAFFKDIARFAASHDCVIGLEPNPKIYNTDFINTLDEALAFVQQINHPGLQINLDFGALIENGIDWSLVKRALPYVSHVHISEPFLAPIQVRDEHRMLIDHLKDIDYAGYISIEMKWHEDIEVVHQVVGYLNELMK